jgi:hypothetical protein
MKLVRYIFILGLFYLLILLFGCGPKSITTDYQDLKSSSKSWIPYSGYESVTFEYDTNVMVFTGTGKETYYEYIRYMTDQSGFFNVQKDYYADFERQSLIFESPTTYYFITYYLERDKGDTGDWDIFRVSVGDGDYYKNEMKIVTYESDKYDKGERFSFKETVTLNEKVFNNVYYLKQERRPFEIYYTQLQGIVAFKLSAKETWTIK